MKAINTFDVKILRNLLSDTFAYQIKSLDADFQYSSRSAFNYRSVSEAQKSAEVELWKFAGLVNIQENN